MRASWSGSCLVLGPGCYASSSCRSMFLVSPSLSRRVSACRCHLIIISSSFFETAHLLIIIVITLVSSDMRVPLSRPSSSFYHIDGHAPSSLSSFPQASGKVPSTAPVIHRLWQAPTSAFVCFTVVVIIVVAPPSGMRTGRTKDGRRWSINCRHQKQCCRLRAWNRRCGACRSPLCTWHR